MEASGRFEFARRAGLIVVLGVTFLLGLSVFTSQFGQPFENQDNPAMWKGTSPAGLLSAGLAASASATLLYVSSYAGTVTTLNLRLPSRNATATLETISTSTGCGGSPSWLTLDYSKTFLFCADEGLTEQTGGLASFLTNPNGTLTPLTRLDVLLGPVSLADSGSGVSAVEVTPEGGLILVQNETYTLAQPGPDPSRQDAPHPHEAILDPTGAYILVPDLGADLVRVFQADADNLTLTPVAPLVAAPGSGPRHGVFLTVVDKTYFYLVSELANTITGYEVVYNANETLGFAELFVIPTHDDDRPLPDGTGAAEIRLSPDEKFLIVSSRWEYSIDIPNYDPTNSTAIASDPLISYAIDRQTGSLAKVQEFAAGGTGPRQFSINGGGDLIAVGLQGDGRVVVIGRDVATGLLKDYVAFADVEGEVTAVVFDED
ncbi:Uu.00g020060.m01.CDS01 [Anthostomella pinea]|uniref:Uu.00g020060.m01.CDS01 n=1 Tax=Anthostomella pinea TaxID=933095 RepID=A0AAI8VZE1_9PEZI|nr:Uu.00g020060.m01.CDS01 [Anthostomella pinea]